MIEAIVRRYSPATLITALVGLSLLDMLLTIACWELGLTEGSPFYSLASYDIILLGIFKLVATGVVAWAIWSFRLTRIAALLVVAMILVCLINVIALVSGVIG